MVQEERDAAMRGILTTCLVIGGLVGEHILPRKTPRPLVSSHSLQNLPRQASPSTRPVPSPSPSTRHLLSYSLQLPTSQAASGSDAPIVAYAVKLANHLASTSPSHSPRSNTLLGSPFAALEQAYSRAGSGAPAEHGGGGYARASLTDSEAVPDNLPTLLAASGRRSVDYVPTPVAASGRRSMDNVCVDRGTAAPPAEATARLGAAEGE